MEEKLKECRVPCKASFGQLETLCRAEQVTCQPLGITKDNLLEYEVEYLCDYKRKVNKNRDTQQEYFLVKWKGFPESMNSWEPRKNLKCVKLLCQFWEDLLKEMQKQRRRMVPKQLDAATASYLVQRAKQRQTLERWERHLNSLGSHHARICVHNHVDLEGPPKNFTYITDYKVGDGITLTQVALGCECADCLESPVGGCCAGASQHRFAYNNAGQVRVRPGLPIYECNKRCRCGPDCPNRVVQRGVRYSLGIFRTDDGRGWGVRTMERIRKNTFVMEYVGEIITTEEAERRGHIYDKEGATYLFDLDYVDDEYTVDAAHYGNISHFVNHSCDPNLQVYNVFIENLDERLPRIAFFATRSIKAGEELTFDYKMHIDPVDAESTKMDSNFGLTGLPGSPKKRQRVECKCGMESCRKYLF
ncbi:histone-lysine N-methyltransferase SUV39H1b isoform X2 [Denticeps clupeoides]|uniref:Histone-lysine N-methyltransferase n=1 Tax=Denticeps clupeoides TaxID=299321 RepID=A0AAY4D6N1_9TELE|nr:histone-lysine N-methyltransferase SUV39H1 isoform X2 [Denticeps clupeoides]